MPAKFDACRKAGGKIRTVKPKEGVYIPVCFLNGKSYRGEVHHKQSSSEGGSPVAAAIKQKMERK
jgi:hypothetical protein